MLSAWLIARVTLALEGLVTQVREGLLILDQAVALMLARVGLVTRGLVVVHTPVQEETHTLAQGAPLTQALEAVHMRGQVGLVILAPVVLVMQAQVAELMQAPVAVADAQASVANFLLNNHVLTRRSSRPAKAGRLAHSLGRPLISLRI